MMMMMIYFHFRFVKELQVYNFSEIYPDHS
jgi:hypothetical protein